MLLKISTLIFAAASYVIAQVTFLRNIDNINIRTPRMDKTSSRRWRIRNMRTYTSLRDPLGSSGAAGRTRALEQFRCRKEKTNRWWPSRLLEKATQQKKKRRKRKTNDPKVSVFHHIKRLFIFWFFGGLFAFVRRVIARVFIFTSQS